jgi:aspartyl protease family protein
MSAGSTLAWVGLGLIGLALLAPRLPRAEAPAAAPAPPVAGFAAPAPAGSPAASSPGHGGAGRALTRSPDGHFYVEAQVNGARIRFIVDTGATMVALTPADAQRAGIALPSERAKAMSAGGEVEVIPVTIDRIAVGPLEARGVRGAVAEQLSVSLLGQSFLGQVGSVEIRGDTMVLR